MGESAVKKHEKRGRFLVIMIAAIAFAMCITISPVHAAGSISGSFGADLDIDGSPSLEGTSFTLYKVGELGKSQDGDPAFVLDSRLSHLNVNVNISKSDKEFNTDGKFDEDKWTEAWLSSAETLANALQDPELAGTLKVDGIENPVVTDSSGHFAFGSVDNGLYLLIGTSQKITGEDGKTVYISPRPMLIMVLDENVELTVKPQMQSFDRFKVTKVWAGSDSDQEKKIRPKSVRINIYYDRTNDPQPVYRDVVLSEDSMTGDKKTPWTFCWESEEGQDDPFLWTIEEQKLTGDAEGRYKCSIDTISAQGYVKVLRLTNTYKGDTHTTKTGDSSHLLIPILLMSAALLILILTLIGARKRRKES